MAETRLNAERLQKAVENEDVDEMAAVSHKMIPLFTLIGATELVALLKLLETSHGVPFTGELKSTPLRPRFDRGCHYSGNSFSVMGEQRRIHDFSLSGTKCRKKLFTL